MAISPSYVLSQLQRRSGKTSTISWRDVPQIADSRGSDSPFMPRTYSGRQVDYAGYRETTGATAITKPTAGSSAGTGSTSIVSGVSSSSGASGARPLVPPSGAALGATSAALRPRPLTALEQRSNDFLSSALGVTESWLRGELPDDVTNAVRQATSEASVRLGLGTGQAGRGLTIRDLGLTSLDLQERGLKYGMQVTDQVEQIREFNRTYDLEVQKVLLSARALDLDAYRVQNELQLRADALALDTIRVHGELALSNTRLGLEREDMYLRGFLGTMEDYPETSASFLERLNP